ncbi:hypothetical protein G7Z17_g8847 [Cylindrodendrum hubeiense]|uniref:Uncharacterized protein n=1 Tax=Cylindrodendrum hubeiense TaxID=595255 RepID=A0A9P5H0J1_9HYPO|nr:hypothetical protein G7Z17_g8847 [Cylindrodendrum hubeiense]
MESNPSIHTFKDPWHVARDTRMGGNWGARRQGPPNTGAYPPRHKYTPSTTNPPAPHEDALLGPAPAQTPGGPPARSGFDAWLQRTCTGDAAALASGLGCSHGPAEASLPPSIYVVLLLPSPIPEAEATLPTPTPIAAACAACICTENHPQRRRAPEPTPRAGFRCSWSASNSRPPSHRGDGAGLVARVARSALAVTSWAQFSPRISLPPLGFPRDLEVPAAEIGRKPQVSYPDPAEPAATQRRWAIPLKSSRSLSSPGPIRTRMSESHSSHSSHSSHRCNLTPSRRSSVNQFSAQHALATRLGRYSSDVALSAMDSVGGACHTCT